MKTKKLSLILMVLIIISIGTVVFAAKCPLCGANGYSSSWESDSSRHRIKHICPASTRLWWWI